MKLPNQEKLSEELLIPNSEEICEECGLPMSEHESGIDLLDNSLLLEWGRRIE